MTVVEIKEAFAAAGFQFSEEEVSEKLSAAKMTADEVDAELMAVWIEAGQQQQSKPAKSGKSGGLTKSQPTQAPAQSPQQQQSTVNAQPVASAIHGTVKELVVVHSQGEKEAIAALAKFYEGTSSRIVDGVNQHLAAMDFSSPLESMVQQQRDSWASTHNAIAEAIANVNTAAGLSNAA